MNQITAVVESAFEEGKQYLQVDYHAVCGCHWVVDMWGNVRSVRICQQCRDIAYPWEDQISLQLLAPE